MRAGVTPGRVIREPITTFRLGATPLTGLTPAAPCLN